MILHDFGVYGREQFLVINLADEPCYNLVNEAPSLSEVRLAMLQENEIHIMVIYW